MHAAGFRNTVALCGTAMCDGHVALLKKYTSQVTVLLDGDRAGEKGSTEAVAILRREGLWAVKGELPAGEDPDSLFRLWGKEAFVSFIRGLRKQLLSSEEVALFNRISRQSFPRLEPVCRYVRSQPEIFVLHNHYYHI